ncbi:MAG: hypothetical protein JJU46_06345 [Balneolaceae bacterium]|nr:hypothetical protein [Balneolaceae bacterium]MCH8548183.1 hypothetical protein [Balneolaceae bacterium]
MRHLYLIVLLPLIYSCATTKEKTTSYDREALSEEATEYKNCFNLSVLNEDDRVLADSLLYSSLNNTGLHTFTSTLKPMSDISSFRWRVEPEDGDDHPSVEFIDEYTQLNRIAEAISCGPLETVLTPFKRVNNGERYVQMRVYRSDAVDRVLEEYPEFWSLWTFAEGSNPAIMIQTMEYESSSSRFRGYGYLYGYPGHAVDFFVEAAESESETGEFVSRDFIQMPVVSGRSGMFVYAVPEGHELNEADREIEEKAHENVRRFNERASEYYEGETFDAESFLRDLFIEMSWVN